jgi:hypothetical protein
MTICQNHIIVHARNPLDTVACLHGILGLEPQKQLAHAVSYELAKPHSILWRQTLKLHRRISPFWYR